MTSKATKAGRRLFRERLQGLSADELLNIKCELGKQLGAMRQELADLNSQIDAVKMEQQRRATITPAGFHITDHAVVRFLERHKGVDIGAVREEISAIATRAKAEARGRKHDAETGLTLGHCERTDNVTTVYRPHELKALEGAA